MSNLKLEIELIPKGAWGNNLRERLSGKDWDTLRNICYEKAKNRCAICGIGDADLEAHEVWDFNISAKTQTLKDIVALCPACHGVKHIRNSERIGYGKHSKSHFMKINNCNELIFAKHYAEAQFLFEERNEVLRWKLKADLAKFGGKGFEINEKEIPLIFNPYENVNWSCVRSQDVFEIVLNEISDNPYVLAPTVKSINIDNYQGIIKIEAINTNKIQWITDEGVFKTKYNTVGKFITEFSVDNLN